MADGKVLVVGGTGHFGRLLVDDLLRFANCSLIVASRHRLRSDRFETVVADLHDPASLEAALSGVSIAICAAGPFQVLPTTLVEICLRRRVHYIDLADDRNFVLKIHSLVPHEADNLPAICTGWSTVPALSGLLTRIASDGLDEVDTVYIHMAPGNRLPRGEATMASLFHSVGQRFTVLNDGKWRTVRGCTQPRSFPFPPPIGPRWGYLIDVPDHALFPAIFHARTVEFRTASELRILNSAVSLLGSLIEKNVVRSWVPWTKILQRGAALPGFLGHDWGALGVEVMGFDGERQVTRRVSLTAHSDGQRIAVMPASVMTAMLASGPKHRGLISPAYWLTREQLVSECERRGFQLVREDF